MLAVRSASGMKCFRSSVFGETCSLFNLILVSARHVTSQKFQRGWRVMLLIRSDFTTTEIDKIYNVICVIFVALICLMV